MKLTTQKENKQIFLLDLKSNLRKYQDEYGEEGTDNMLDFIVNDIDNKYQDIK